MLYYLGIRKNPSFSSSECMIINNYPIFSKVVKEGVMNWYAVITSSGNEDALCRYIQNELHLSAIFPTAQRHFRIKQQDLLVDKAMVKGCIFVECDLDKNSLVYLLHQQSLFPIEHVEEMSMKSMGLLLPMLSDTHRIDMSVGISVNHRAQVQQGPLVGMESHILKVNAHKRLASLDIYIKDTPLLAGLEIKEKR